MSVYVALPTELQTSVFVAGRGIEPLSVPYDGLLLIELLYDSLSEIGRFLTVLPLHQPAM